MNRLSITRSFVAIGVALAGFGCADETIGPKPAEFDELCGVEGPVEILTLDSSQTFDSVHIRAIGERYVVSLTTYPEHEDEEFGAEVWSVGMCGEDPILMTNEAERFVIQLEQWPEAVFMCDADSEQLWIYDPTGAHASQPVFDAGDCQFRASPDGLLTIEGGEDSGTLVFQPWPEDPWAAPAEQVVLHDDVRRQAVEPTHIGPAIAGVVRVGEGEVFALTSSDALVAIDLADANVELLAESVYEFKLSPSGRFVLWQDLEVSGGSEDWPHGPVSILDRETGVVTVLADTSLAYTQDPFVLESLGLLYLRHAGWNEPEAATYLELPTMSPVASLVPGVAPRRVLDGTRVLFSGFVARSVQVVDIATGQTTAIYDGPAVRASYREDGLTVLTGEGKALRSISYSGDEELLAREASRGYDIGPDGRVFSPYAVVDDVGQLVVIDPLSLDAFAIDEDVLTNFIRAHADSEGESIVAYAVVDPERYGIWAANPLD